MQPKAIHLFTNLAGALLLAFAMALAVSICEADAGLVWPHESVMMISLRTLYWILAALTGGVALVCLFGRHARFKAAFIFWLMLNVTIYGLGVHWNGHNGSLSAYWNNLAEAFGIAPGPACLLLAMLYFYLLLGSSLSLAWLWMGRSKIQDENFFKICCHACGGHIQFAAKNLGQSISCPHCQAALVLRQAESLKMSCFFCKGHIGFPPHALGQKIACPHCKMNITLMEPV